MRQRLEYTQHQDSIVEHLAPMAESVHTCITEHDKACFLQNTVEHNVAVPTGHEAVEVDDVELISQ